MTTKTKLIAYLNHYNQVLDTIHFMNLHSTNLYFINQVSVKEDVELFNNEEGIKQLQKIIDEAKNLINSKDINKKYFFKCRFYGHILTNTKFNCKKGCPGCSLCPFPPLEDFVKDMIKIFKGH